MKKFKFELVAEDGGNLLDDDGQGCLLDLSWSMVFLVPLLDLPEEPAVSLRSELESESRNRHTAPLFRCLVLVKGLCWFHLAILIELDNSGVQAVDEEFKAELRVALTTL